MKKWLFRLLGLGLCGYFIVAVYGMHRGGYFSLPEIPDNAYPISFKSGFRAIVIDDDVAEPYFSGGPKYFRRLSLANSDRKYLGLPFEIQPWFQHVWSWCRVPTEVDLKDFAAMPDDIQKRYAGARFDAVCSIIVDGREIPRGIILSVPKL